MKRKLTRKTLKIATVQKKSNKKTDQENSEKSNWLGKFCKENLPEQILKIATDHENSEQKTNQNNSEQKTNQNNSEKKTDQEIHNSGLN